MEKSIRGLGVILVLGMLLDLIFLGIGSYTLIHFVDDANLPTPESPRSTRVLLIGLIICYGYKAA